MHQSDLDKSLSYYEFLFKYKGGFIFDEEYVPFWFKTLIGCLDVLGPETDSDLERISNLLYNANSYGELHEMSQSTLDEIALIRGPRYTYGENTIDLKYMMLNDLLRGASLEQFGLNVWAQHLLFAIDDELDYGNNMAIMDERLKKAAESIFIDIDSAQ